MYDECGGTNDGPMTLIVEPNHSGHRLYYAALVARWCRSKGQSVAILTTAEAVDSQQWATHLASETLGIILNPPDAFSLPDIKKAAIEAQAVLTLLPDGDRYLLPILRHGWSGPGELSLLVMRVDGQAGPPLRWARPAKGLAKKTLAWGAGLQSGVRVSALRSPLVQRRGPLRWAPDPVTLLCTPADVQHMRHLLESYGQRYWFGVFGSITPRKNLPIVVEAILGQPDVGLLIAGAVDHRVSEATAPILAEFAASGGQVLHLPGTLTDAEFDGAISAVDCVVAAHSNEGSSGVALKAAASGRRLLLAGAKSLRQEAAFLGEQATWSPLDVEKLRAAVEHARRSPAPQTTLEIGTQGFLTALT